MMWLRWIANELLPPGVRHQKGRAQS